MQRLKVKVLLAQLCPTLFNPMDCSPPGYRMQCLSIIYTQIPVQSVIRKQPTLWILLNCLNLKGMLVCPPLVSNSCHYWDSHLRSSGFCGLFWDCLKKKKIFFKLEWIARYSQCSSNGGRKYSLPSQYLDSAHCHQWWNDPLQVLRRKRQNGTPTVFLFADHHSKVELAVIEINHGENIKISLLR